MLRFIARSILHSVRTSIALHTASVLTVALSMGLIVFSFTTARSLRSWTQLLDSNVRFMVQTDQKSSHAVRQALQQQNDLGNIEILSPESVADSISRVLNMEAPDVLKELDLPVILRVTPLSADTGTLLELAERIAKVPGVLSVEYGQRWIKRFRELSGTVLKGSIGLSLLLTGMALMILVTTFTLVLYGRRRELEIMVLVGASPTHIYAPILIEGILQSLLGTGIAIAVSTVFWNYASHEVVIFGAPLMVDLSASTMVAYLVLGVLLGGISSVIAMMQSIVSINEEE